MIISVRAKPGSKKPGIEQLADGSYEVRVAARAAEGKANAALAAALAEQFNVAASRVRLVSGEKSKLKRFEVPDAG